MRVIILLVFLLSCLSREIILANRYHQRQCLSCSTRHFEDYKMWRQEQILDDLLLKLDLPIKPNVSMDHNNLPPLNRYSPKVRQLLETTVHRRRFRREMASAKEELYPALYETDSEVTPQLSYIVGTASKDYEEVALFNFSNNYRNKLITQAILHVHIRPPVFIDNDDTISVRVNVYEQMATGVKGDKIATKHVHLHGTNVPYGIFRIHLDEFDVERWLEEANSDRKVLRLHVEAIHDGINLAVHPTDKNAENMYLELKMLDKNIRSKRTTNICQAGANETKCCLYDLIIDFEKVGWEFVIAPKRYNAYICSGECSTGQMASTARGTIAQHAKVDFFQCCHPKDYAGITIVYVTNDSQIWVKEVPGMIARKCGCA